VIKAVNNGIILSSIMLFAFFTTNIQISDIFDGLSLALSDSFQGSKFFLQILIQQVLAPIFNLIVILYIFSLNEKINKDEFEGMASVKGFLICNSIFLGIIVIALGFVNRYTNVIDYIDLIYKNIPLVLVTALVFVTGVNDFELPKDRKYLTSKKKNDTAEDDEEEPISE
jgi:hypothetical protein